MAEVGPKTSAEVSEKLGYGKPSTERSRRLKESIWGKHCRGGEFAEEGVRLCMERARLITQAMKEVDGWPYPLRRAHCVEKIFDGVTVWVKEGQLILGAPGSAPHKLPWNPEHPALANMELAESNYVEPQDAAEIKEIFDYWEDKNMFSVTQRELPAPIEAETIWRAGAFVDPTRRAWRYDSPSLPYEEVAAQGLGWRLEWIEKRMKEESDWIWSKGAYKGNSFEIYDRMEARTNLEAMAIALKAWMRWCRRHGRLAKIVAENFDIDPKWREELKDVEKSCTKVATEPCEGLLDVLQFHWFIMLGAQAMEAELCGASMKYDELIEPYLKHDLETGKLTYEQAVEMCELHRLLFVEKGRWTMRFAREVVTGSNELFITTIGGIRRDGTDACSVATNAILDAAFSIRTAEPSIVFRWHPKANIETLRKVFDCLRTGLGFPNILNDAQNIEYNLAYGAPLEEARHWGVILCMSAGPVGGRLGARGRNVKDHWPAKMCELLFQDPPGFDANFSGLQIYPPELFKDDEPPYKDPTKYKSSDEVIKAVSVLLEYTLKLSWLDNMITRHVYSKYFQQPFMSSLYDGCVELGEDLNTRDEFPNFWDGPICALEWGDAVADLQKLVFDEKKYTMEEVIRALRADWEGYEEMRQDFLKAPKFGNDDDFVDKIVAKVWDMYADIGAKFAPPSPKYGTKDTPLPIRPLAQSVAAYATWGPRTGALPNGRKQGDPCTDGGLSPWAGFDKKGPTAVLKSESKVDVGRHKGALLNQRLNPQQMKGEKGFMLWYNYMKTWYDLNIEQVQFNCVDTETLRSAQKEPEKYSDVIVRVAGYSARFVDLSTYIQNSVIARVTQDLA